jgi:DNA-binding transcriptional LysR family regulator
MNYDLLSLKCAYEVYNLKSMTLAAKKLSLSKVAVSKRITALEEVLGLKLFLRTTRMIQPTPESHAIIEDLSIVFEKLSGIEKNTRGSSHHGLIKISSNASMAHSFLSELLSEYQVLHPQVKIELLVSDSVLNLQEHNIDLTIRLNPDRNSPLVGKKVGHYSLSLVASPEYLKKHKKINSPKALINHPILAIDQHFNRGLDTHKEVFKVLEENRLFRTNDTNLITKKIIAGEGIGLRSNWDVKKLVKEKKLITLLPELFSEPINAVWVLSHPERIKLERVRALADFLHQKVPPYLI